MYPLNGIFPWFFVHEVYFLGVEVVQGENSPCNCVLAHSRPVYKFAWKVGPGWASSQVILIVFRRMDLALHISVVSRWELLVSTK